MQPTSSPFESELLSPKDTSQAAAAALEQQPQLQFTSNLNILRGTAVSLVLLNHILRIWDLQHGALSFLDEIGLSLGRLGVLLFFVHTSLVLCFSLERSGTRGWRLFRTFLVRRAFRIYPLSIVCVLAVLAFHIPSMPYTEFVPYSWGGWLSNLALTTDLTGTEPALGPLWSLPLEVQMYIALPILFMLLGPTRSPWIALGLWLMASILAWLFPTLTQMHVTDFAPCFIAGIVAYTMSSRSSNRLPGLLWTPFLLTMVGLFVILGRSVPHGYNNLPYEWLFCLTLGLLIPLFRDSTLPAINSVASQVARYSYGIYLFHCIALWIGCGLLGGLPLPSRWVISAGLTVVMSLAGYHLVEKPAIDLGRRLSGSPRPALAGRDSVYP